MPLPLILSESVRSSAKAWVHPLPRPGEFDVCDCSSCPVFCDGSVYEFSVVRFSTVLLGEVMREHEVSKGASVQGEEGARD